MHYVLFGRLKSSLERAQRLTQSFTDGLLAVLPERANTFGRALGIQDERIQVKFPAAKHACLLSSSFDCLRSNIQTVVVGNWHSAGMHSSAHTDD